MRTVMCPTIVINDNNHNELLINSSFIGGVARSPSTRCSMTTLLINYAAR